SGKRHIFAYDLQIRAADEAVESPATQGRSQYFVPEIAEVLIAHGRDFRGGRFDVIETIFRRIGNVMGTNSHFDIARCLASRQTERGGSKANKKSSSRNHRMPGQILRLSRELISHI